MFQCFVSTYSYCGVSKSQIFGWLLFYSFTTNISSAAEFMALLFKYSNHYVAVVRNKHLRYKNLCDILSLKNASYLACWNSTWK